MTHDELTARAIRWLKRSARVESQGGKGINRACSVVLSELVSAAGEVPDAIGWNSGFSILVECKVSRSDYYADKAKSWRKNGRGMGNYRYYMTPPGLLVRKNLPEEWGLLEVDGRRVEIVRLASFQESNKVDEVRLLCSAVRRGQKSK